MFRLSLYQFDPDDVDLDLGLPVSDKEEFRYIPLSIIIPILYFGFSDIAFKYHYLNVISQKRPFFS